MAIQQEHVSLQGQGLTMKKMLAVLVAAVAIAGCGTRSDLNDPSDGTSCQINIVRHDPGGWLLTQPDVHLDFWGNWSSETVFTPTYFWSTWFNLLESDEVLSRLSEYGIHHGSMDPYFYGNNQSPTLGHSGFVTDAGATEIDDSTIVPQLQTEIQLGLLPFPDDNSLYVVMLAPGLTTTDIVTNHWGGYHHSASYGSQKFAYAVVTFGDDGTNVTLSHETYEAATDPDNSTGYYDRSSGNEVGDVCQGNNYTLDGTAVQFVWSQALCSCQ